MGILDHLLAACTHLVSSQLPQVLPTFCISGSLVNQGTFICFRADLADIFHGRTSCDMQREPAEFPFFPSGAEPLGVAMILAQAAQFPSACNLRDTRRRRSCEMSVGGALLCIQFLGTCRSQN